MRAVVRESHDEALEMLWSRTEQSIEDDRRGRQGPEDAAAYEHADALYHYAQAHFKALWDSAPDLLAALENALIGLENAREFVMRFDEADEEEIAASQAISGTIETVEAAIAKARGNG